MATSLASFEKLNNENYEDWEARARGLMKIKGCWQAVMRDEPAPWDPDFETRNDIAEGIILTTIDGNALKQIKGCVSANQMWEKLKVTQSTYEAYHGMTALDEYSTSYKCPDETMEQFFDRKMALLQIIRGSGMVISDQQAAMQMMMKLPKEYEYLRRTARTAEEDFNLSTFKRTILEEKKVAIDQRIERETNRAYMMERQRTSESSSTKQDKGHAQ